MTNRRSALAPLFLLSLLFSVGLEASPLRIGVVEGAKFGYRYDGVDSNRESASFEFPGQSSDLVLTYSVFDIDGSNEVSIELNGQFLGYVVQTANDATRRGLIVIPESRLVGGENEIVFRQRSPGYIWGVTDLRLDESSLAANAGSLALDVADDSPYGYRYRDQTVHREGVTLTFQGSGEDLTLYYSAYDIDFAREVAVELNGAVIGHLAETGDRETRDDFLVLPASEQVSGQNSLVFRQWRPGNTWGMSALLLVNYWCS